MIENTDLNVFPLCDALCDYFNRETSRYAERINDYMEDLEDREEVPEDIIVSFEVPDESGFFMFDFVDGEVVTESINDELEAIGNGDFYITDYETDRNSKLIVFKIEYY